MRAYLPAFPAADQLEDHDGPRVPGSCRAHLAGLPRAGLQQEVLRLVVQQVPEPLRVAAVVQQVWGRPTEQELEHRQAAAHLRALVAALHRARPARQAARLVDGPRALRLMVQTKPEADSRRAARLVQRSAVEVAAELLSARLAEVPQQAEAEEAQLWEPRPEEAVVAQPLAQRTAEAAEPPSVRQVAAEAQREAQPPEVVAEVVRPWELLVVAAAATCAALQPEEVAAVAGAAQLSAVQAAAVAAAVLPSVALAAQEAELLVRRPAAVPLAAASACRPDRAPAPPVQG